MPLPLIVVYPVVSTVLCAGVGVVLARTRAQSKAALDQERSGQSGDPKVAKPTAKRIKSVRPKRVASATVEERTQPLGVSRAGPTETQSVSLPLRRRRRKSKSLRTSPGTKLPSAPSDSLLTTAFSKENWPVTASTAAIMTAVASVATPVLVTPSLGLALVAALPVFRRLLTKLPKGQIDVDFLTSLLVVGGIGTGQSVVASLLIFLEHVSHKLITISEDMTRGELRNYFSAQRGCAWVISDGVEVEVPVERLDKGSRVVVSAGDVVPVDGTVVAGTAMVDQQTLFGEQDPVTKGTSDQVFAGTTVVGGRLEIQVERAGTETVASQITTLLENTTDYRTNLQRRSEVELKRNVPLVIAGSAVALPLLGPSAAMALLLCCPPLMFHYTAPYATLTALNVATRRGALIKDGRALEVLSRVDLILFDKTGTLTLEVPEIGAVFASSPFATGEVLAYAAAAEGRQTHPIARAIRAKAGTQAAMVDSAENEYVVGGGVKTIVNGREVVVGNLRLMDAVGARLPEAIDTVVQIWSDAGSTVILVAVDGMVAGALEVRHRLRPGAKACISALQQRGVTCQIVSGDNEGATATVANWLGIETWYAGQLPDQKRQVVEAARQAGRTVCFVGDGINDSVALKAADISISMKGASTAAVDQAGVILLDPNLGHILELMDIAADYRRSNKLGLGISYAFPIAGIFATVGAGTSPLFALLLEDIAFWGAFGAATFGIQQSRTRKWRRSSRLMRLKPARLGHGHGTAVPEPVVDVHEVRPLDRHALCSSGT